MTDIKLVVRDCKNKCCTLKFKVLPTSTQEFCSQYCATGTTGYKVWKRSKESKTEKVEIKAEDRGKSRVSYSRNIGNSMTHSWLDPSLI